MLDFSREDEQRDAGYGTTEIRLRIPDDPLGGETRAAHALDARGSGRTAISSVARQGPLTRWMRAAAAGRLLALAS